MVRKICSDSLAALAAVAIGVTALVGCDEEKSVEGAPPSGEPVTVQRSAVTAAAPPTRAAMMPPGAYRESDIRPLPAAAVQGAARPAMRLPGQNRGFAVVKPPATAAVGSAAAPFPPPAQYVAKQNEYLRQLKDLQPTLANLPEAEQNARRAALKRSVLGD